MWRLFLLLFWVDAALAQSVVAARNLPAQTIVSDGDLMLVEAALKDAISVPADAVGLETRVAIYAGRPIRVADLAPPALIERNAVVVIEYRSGGVLIRAEGRALARGSLGEVVRVMNLSSRTTVTGRIGADGLIQVGGRP